MAVIIFKKSLLYLDYLKIRKSFLCEISVKDINVIGLYGSTNEQVFVKSNQALVIYQIG